WHFLRYSTTGLRLRERVVLMIPVIGRVHRASVISRFLRSVATAVTTGVPLPQAMRLASQATGSAMLERDADYLASEIEQGHSIMTAARSARVIPPLFGFCTQVATSRDSLPVAIAELARSYE